MRHRQIEAFRSVMIAGSITDAAKALHVSQPSVSRLIADLETSIGLVLFERKHGRLYPTAEAARLFEEVERSFQSLESLARYARTLADLRGAQLTISGMPALCLDLVPTLVSTFMRQYPRAKITVDARSSDQVVEAIALQRCDVGFATPPFDVPGVTPVLDIVAPCLLVMRANHRLAVRGVVSMSDLRGEKLILLSDLAVREALRQQLAAAGIDDLDSIDTTLSIVAYRLVDKGMGVALVDPFTALAFDHHPELLVKPLEPTIPFRFGVLAPARRASSKATREIIDVARAALESMRRDKQIPLVMKVIDEAISQRRERASL